MDKIQGEINHLAKLATFELDCSSKGFQFIYQRSEAGGVARRKFTRQEVGKFDGITLGESGEDLTPSTVQLIHRTQKVLALEP
jgi:hypothetical protein